MDLLIPEQHRGVGALVLAGSSGRVDIDRARLLTRKGAVTLPLRWFGGHGQQPGPWDVPIETFTRALDLLQQEADTLAVVGTSFGAEAALVTAALDVRVRAVVAFAPTSVVWAGYDEPRHRWTSHWTWRTEVVPYMPIRRPVPSAPPDVTPRYLPIYEHSMAVATAEERRRGAIRVEAIPEVMLVSGGDDQVWPSSRFAEQIVARRREAGRFTTHVHLAEAGHRVVLPGEQPPAEGRSMARGGTPEADKTLGELAWPHVLDVLQLR